MARAELAVYALLRYGRTAREGRGGGGVFDYNALEQVLRIPDYNSLEQV